MGVLIAPTWPIYASGLEQDDQLQEVAGQRLKTEADLNTALGRHKPGERISIVFTDRTGQSKSATVTMAEDPHLEVVPLDAPTAAQKAFRERWLSALRPEP